MTEALKLAEEAKREADAIRGDFESSLKLHSLIDRLAALALQAESEARDAARYRWLRDLSTPAICAFYLSVGKAFEGVKFARETVDEAIDAQISGMAEKEQTR